MAASVVFAVSISQRAAAFLPCVRRCVSRPSAALFAPLSKVRFFSDDRSSSASRLTERKTGAYDKWILALYKRYPKGQVPDFVPSAIIEKTRNKARIHLNLILAFLTLMGAFLAASSGRRRQERGDSVTKMNLEWHEKQKGS
ncbi:protein FAM162B [Dermacentor variabilis]|uniref:protein FAM162B n=1 Tax=Dermacentor variabilis TaxID=34621 RepID=UPI003F5BB71E